MPLLVVCDTRTFFSVDDLRGGHTQRTGACGEIWSASIMSRASCLLDSVLMPVVCCVKDRDGLSIDVSIIAVN